MVWKEVDHLRGMTLPCCGIYKYRDYLHRGMGATVVLSPEVRIWTHELAGALWNRL